MRESKIKRDTTETNISLSLNLDGSGKSNIDTGCPFLNHMLTLFAKHSRFDLDVMCKGDTDVDYHHTTEDIGISLGKAISEALGEKKGIERYGDIILPMDEALIMASVDISGRGDLFSVFQIPAHKVGDFDTELCEEFFRSFAKNAGITLHIRQISGTNSHHIIEGAFKAVARVLAKATSVNEKYKDEVPSTKGVL
jgi:imidazoleglycerol-phosphate dehydratase